MSSLQQQDATDIETDDPETTDVAEEQAEQIEEAETPDRVPLDVVFGILKNERRRLVLEYLADHESQTSLSDLAEHIASIENDKPAAELGSQERKRVYVGLYQCHLPRMHDSGAIDFDKNRGTVASGANIDQFYEYLARAEPDPTPWSRYYLGHAGVSVALVGGAMLLGTLVNVAFAISIAGFVALALVQAARSEN